MEARWLASSASAVLVPDHATQALSRGGELVFELPDPLLGGAGFGGAGVPLGPKLAVDGLQVGNPGDQLGPVRPVDLGAEMQAQALAEPFPVGSEHLDLVPGHGEVGAQAGWRGRVPGRNGRRGGCDTAVGLATSSGFDALPDAVRVD